MAGVAGSMLNDATIVAGLVRTLERLRDLQGPEGQIASNYEIREDGPPQVSFGSLAPRIDANGWYLVGIALAARAGAIDPRPFTDSVRRVVRLLDTLEYNGRHLIYVPPGGNWADEYPYEGYVLSDQVLRAWALRFVSVIYDEPSWHEKAGLISRTIEERYGPEANSEAGHPIAAFTPTRTYDVFDLAATALLALSGVAPHVGRAAVAWVAERFLGRGELPPAFHPVIDERHPDWPALRRYHRYAFRNRPYEYHNAGIWPIWVGWLALGLARTGRTTELTQLRERFTSVVGPPSRFEFEEYLHGQTSAPAGTPCMAYSATGVVFLQLADSPRALQLLDP